MSRQSKVVKKHEVWFLFSGKPVRFSLGEFAIVPLSSHSPPISLRSHTGVFKMRALRGLKVTTLMMKMRIKRV